jgi:TetR/AcrR family transcriptional regulator, mexJK operon transcriptional repressor
MASKTINRPRQRSAARKPRGGQAGRPTAAELARRKALVMAVATEQFIANGYAGTSLIDIARGAGVATRTLYQHFGDKEALFREVIFARDAAGAITKPQVEDGDTLFDALMRAARYALEVTFRPHSIGLMRLMIAESQRFPEFMKQTAMSIFARFERNIERVFTTLEAAGTIPPGDHARSVTIFNDVITGSRPLMTYTDWRSGPPSDAELEDRIEFFIRGRYGEDMLRNARTLRVGLPASD